MTMRTTALLALILALFGVANSTTLYGKLQKPAAKDAAKAKAALQELQDFIGLWNLEGTQKAGGKTDAWKEKVNWGWKFKDGDAWIAVDFTEGKGKYFAAGDLRYDVPRKKYALKLTTADKNDLLFEGTIVRGDLKLEGKDAKTGDVHRLTINTLAEGIRMQIKYEKQDGGKGLFSNVFAMNGNKDGQSIAGGTKKPECIVSGGAATISVSFQGKPYFVCCSGCRDEFNANPEKYVAAAKK
jgi:YHS domain-containing protein